LLMAFFGRVPVALAIERKQKSIESQAKSDEPSRARRRLIGRLASRGEALLPIGDELVASAGHKKASGAKKALCPRPIVAVLWGNGSRIELIVRTCDGT